MSARSGVSAVRDWKPGWRTGIADNIATTSAVSTRRHSRHSRRAWRALLRIVFALAVVGLLIALRQ